MLQSPARKIASKGKDVSVSFSASSHFQHSSDPTLEPSNHSTQETSWMQNPINQGTSLSDSQMVSGQLNP